MHWLEATPTQQRAGDGKCRLSIISYIASIVILHFIIQLHTIVNIAVILTETYLTCARYEERPVN